MPASGAVSRTAAGAADWNLNDLGPYFEALDLGKQSSPPHLADEESKLACRSEARVCKCRLEPPLVAPPHDDRCVLSGACMECAPGDLTEPCGDDRPRVSPGGE